MNGVFIDSNVILLHFAGNEKAKEILKMCERKEIEGYVNSIVFSEVLYNFIKIVTHLKPFQLKRAKKIVASVQFSDIRDIFDLFHILEINKEILEISLEIINTYGLLPNDALIAATCRYYGIGKIATFDEDFEKVDFLEVVKV